MISLILLKDLAVLGLLVYIITHLLEFERKWRKDSDTSSRLMKLNHSGSKTAFAMLFIATVFSTIGTYFLASENFTYMIAMFDISLVFWAVFFKIMTDIVGNSENKWFG